MCYEQKCKVVSFNLAHPVQLKPKYFNVKISQVSNSEQAVHIETIPNVSLISDQYIG